MIQTVADFLGVAIGSEYYWVAVAVGGIVTLAAFELIVYLFRWGVGLGRR